MTTKKKTTGTRPAPLIESELAAIERRAQLDPPADISRFNDAVRAYRRDIIRLAAEIRRLRAGGAPENTQSRMQL